MIGSNQMLKGAVDNFSTFSTFPTLVFQSGIIFAPLPERQTRTRSISSEPTTTNNTRHAFVWKSEVK